MAEQKTLGFKVPDEFHDEVKDMIETSGLTGKDWIQKAAALMKTNDLKEGSSEFKSDLTELEVHTTRIYELIANMVQRSVYLKDAAVNEVQQKLAETQGVIGQYQEKVKTLEETNKDLQVQSSNTQKELEEILEQLNQARTTNENNQELIKEYKEKIDTLSGLVSKYQSYADENEKLKLGFEQERKQFKSQVNEVIGQNEEQQTEINELTRKLETAQREYETEIERLNEKKELEKDKALLEQERNFQKEIQAMNEDHNQKIKQLHDEIGIIRKESDKKIEQLQKNKDKELADMRKEFELKIKAYEEQIKKENKN